MESEHRASSAGVEQALADAPARPRGGDAAVGFVDMGAFGPQTADKVSRLLDIAYELGRHPRLSGKLVMHGGTAINLFMLDVPRLSVDIDLSYVGAIDRDAMLAERPAIERGIMDVGAELGYLVDTGQPGHAGRTFMLRYAGAWGQDHVKIDCIYMAAANNPEALWKLQNLRKMGAGED